jgi:putative transposase
MGYRLFSLAPGGFFHIYNRGNSKQTIFHDAQDYQRFIVSLYVLNSSEPFKLHFIKDPYSLDRGEQLVSIGAYCLMPNHFHILLTPLVENGVSQLMKKVMTGYAMYFNNKYERTGALFEGRFKAQNANEDVYLKYLYAYIHLNPVKLIQSNWKEAGVLNVEKTKKYLQAYRYSSYMDYVGNNRKESQILDASKFPEYFQSPEEFEMNIFEWFEQNKPE